MGLADIVDTARGRSKEERDQVPRRTRLAMALFEVERDINEIIAYGHRMSEASQVALEGEYHQLGEFRNDLLSGNFPRQDRFENYVVDGDYECGECLDGHRPECDDARSDDLYDAMWKTCRGCCPNGCFEHGLARSATIGGARALSMINGGRQQIIELCAANPGGSKGPICDGCGGFGFIDYGPDSATGTCEACGGHGVDKLKLEESFMDEPPSGGPTIP
jgi:hypothetical protein